MHWLYESVCQGLDVLPVQVGGGLIQGQDSTVKTEGLCQSEPDDQGCQHLNTHTGSIHPTKQEFKWRRRWHRKSFKYLLTGTAAPSHIHVCVSSHHHYSVVVAPPPLRPLLHLRPDLDVLDICRGDTRWRPNTHIYPLSSFLVIRRVKCVWDVWITLCCSFIDTSTSSITELIFVWGGQWDAPWPL